MTKFTQTCPTDLKYSEWLQNMLERGKLASAKVRARALFNAGFLAPGQNDYEQGISMCEESLALYRERGDKANMAEALHNLRIAAIDQRDFVRGVNRVDESLALRTAIGDKRGVGYSQGMLGQAALAQGKYRLARQHLEGGSNFCANWMTSGALDFNLRC